MGASTRVVISKERLDTNHDCFDFRCNHFACLARTHDMNNRQTNDCGNLAKPIDTQFGCLIEPGELKVTHETSARRGAVLWGKFAAFPLFQHDDANKTSRPSPISTAPTTHYMQGYKIETYYILGYAKTSLLFLGVGYNVSLSYYL